MNYQTKRHLIIAALIFASASFARADSMNFDIGITAQDTLKSLGHDFTIGCVAVAIGCVALAIGKVLAAIIGRKK